MYFLACDIGASSGRHILGSIGTDGKIVLQELYRFDNSCEMKNGHLCWDMEALSHHMLEGLKAAKPYQPVSFGIDTWAVDYVLLDENNKIIGDAVAYRDDRTYGIDKRLEQSLPFDKHYALSGIAKQPFNTVYQLMTTPQIDKAATFLMIPDFLHYILTGKKCNEYTNASTTALLNANTRTWDQQVLKTAGIPCALFSSKPLMPGEFLGRFLPEIENEIGYSCQVILPATHDTGSAFMAVPAKDDKAAYLSSGTWSLLGVELDAPIANAASIEAGFTNEGGYDGKVRFLKNIMGLWILQCVRKEQGKRYTFAEMADMAQQHEDFPSVFDANASRFLAPASMSEEIVSALREDGQQLPTCDGELFSCIYHSLAECYRDAVYKLEQLTHKRYTSMNITGGGSQSKPLNQWTADVLGIPVYAGPAEGTALGNIIAQMIAAGLLKDLQTARKTISHSFDIKTYYPSVLPPYN